MQVGKVCPGFRPATFFRSIGMSQRSRVLLKSLRYVLKCCQAQWQWNGECFQAAAVSVVSNPASANRAQSAKCMPQVQLACRTAGETLISQTGHAARL